MGQKDDIIKTMSQGLTIQFYCTKRNAKKFLQLTADAIAREFPELLNEPCKVTITKNSNIKEFRIFVHLWNIVRKSRESALYASNDLLTRQQAENIFCWLRCYANSGYFSNKKEYCFIEPGLKELHGWGCKWLNSVARHPGFLGKVPWYQIGPFDGIVQFIDKQEIKDRLAGESEAKYLNICPLFSLLKAFKYVDLLPDQINPETNPDWEYDYSSDPAAINGKKGIYPKPIKKSFMLNDGEEI